MVVSDVCRDVALAHFLLRKIRPRVDRVLSAIQKHVISFSLRGSGGCSVVAGFSTYGSSSSSWDSRGSMLSTRPSVEGRFSTVVAVSARPARWRRPWFLTHRCGLLRERATVGGSVVTMRSCQRAREQWPEEEGSGGAGVWYRCGRGGDSIVEMRGRKGRTERGHSAHSNQEHRKQRRCKRTHGREGEKESPGGSRETKSVARLAYGCQEGVSASPVGSVNGIRCKGQKRAGSNHCTGSATLHSL